MKLSSELLATLQASRTVVGAANNVLDSEVLTKTLMSTQLSQVPPKQTVHGLRNCEDELSTMRQILFIRTVSQDQMFGVDRLTECCEALHEKLKKENDPYQADELPRVDFNRISPEEFFQKHVNNPQPVVIENCQYAQESMTLEDTVRRYSQEYVPLMSVKDKEHYVGPLQDVLDKPVVLSHGDRLVAEHPEILEGLNLNQFLPYIRLNRFADQLFISNCGSGSTAHFGTNTNLFFMLEGKKKWTIIDPNFFYLSYPTFLPMDGKTALSWMDEADTERCPLFKYCPRYEVTLEPGELLLNPHYFFHSVRNMTKKTMALGLRWFGEPGVNFKDPCPLYTNASYLSPKGMDVLFHIRRMLEILELTGERPPSLFENIAKGMQADPNLDCNQSWGVEAPNYDAYLHKDESAGLKL